MNTFEDDQHNYENYAAQAARNPYEDDVQTVHSEGVRSEYEPPPIPERPQNGRRPGGEAEDDEQAEYEEEEEGVVLGLGELGEADERVQRYYGIIPKEKVTEIKTVRMVKRDHKERNSKVSLRGEKRWGGGEKIGLYLRLGFRIRHVHKVYSEYIMWTEE